MINSSIRMNRLIPDGYIRGYIYEILEMMELRLAFTSVQSSQA
jgi:hypothetical protein